MNKLLGASGFSWCIGLPTSFSSSCFSYLFSLVTRSFIEITDSSIHNSSSRVTLAIVDTIDRPPLDDEDRDTVFCGS